MITRTRRFVLLLAASAVLLPALYSGRLAASECKRTSVGLVPLTDLVRGTYLGFPGGLYPGSNLRPVLHDVSGMEQATLVQPLDPQGRPSASGRIGLVSIGMSNTSSEFSQFMGLASESSLKNPAVVLVNGAQSGASAEVVGSPETRAGASYWEGVEQKVGNSGLTPAQVQVAWIKEALAGPRQAFPQDALTLQGYLVAAVHELKERFPNVRLTFVSSRIYAGYASTNLNPEPYAYQSAFAVKWLVEDQIQGDRSLNYDREQGSVVAPWLAWGPYLWADGLRPNSNGLTWECTDLRDDGTHPSRMGQQKVAELLLEFFTTDPVTRPWFVGGGDRPTRTR